MLYETGVSGYGHVTVGFGNGTVLLAGYPVVLGRQPAPDLLRSVAEYWRVLREPMTTS